MSIRQNVQMLTAQREFFLAGKTRTIEFRAKMLQQLESCILKHEYEILRALQQDLRKPEHEAWMSEVGVVLDELRLTKKNLKKWMRPKCVRSGRILFPSKARIHYDPLGVVLVIGPWNYPFQLLMAPLIGAIAAGNCVVLKPSEVSSHTAKLVQKMMASTFSEEYIRVVEGGVETTTELLKQKFDHIFFTGSTAVGKIVMQAAAQNLIPITLELGGKSPVIVDGTADLDLAARRITWGKVFNAGQTCVGPDYLLVDASIHDLLIEKIKQEIRKQLGEDSQQSASYTRIINTRHFRRLSNLVSKSKVIFGGKTDEKDLYIQPTLIAPAQWNDPIMQEEIFGPLLPIIKFDKIENAIQAVNQQDTPLSAYLFSNSRQNIDLFVKTTRFGGGCINDVLAHFGNPFLPFGGLGPSGMGRYHGEASFRTFSNHKGVLRRYGVFDLDMRYAPYNSKKTRLLKWLFS